jgi:hypothetical protein
MLFLLTLMLVTSINVRRKIIKPALMLGGRALNQH